MYFTLFFSSRFSDVVYEILIFDMRATYRVHLILSDGRNNSFWRVKINNVLIPVTSTLVYMLSLAIFVESLVENVCMKPGHCLIETSGAAA
jgi:hypothetical protein